MKQTGRSFSLDDVEAIDEEMPDIDDLATSKPHEDLDDESEASRLRPQSASEPQAEACGLRLEA